MSTSSHAKNSLLETTLALPCASIAERCIDIRPDAHDDDVIALTQRLLAVSRFSSWALAGALFELLERKGESWLNVFCTANAIAPKLRRELLGVHTFYSPTHRTHALTYQHYRDAMLIVNDGKPKALQRATHHLAQAEAHGWSVSELRKHTRTATATQQPVEEQEVFASYQSVHDFARYARHELPTLASWSAERVDLVLADLADGIELIDRLRELRRLRKP